MSNKTLRRQPSMADIGGRLQVEVEKREPRMKWMKSMYGLGESV